MVLDQHAPGTVAKKSREGSKFRVSVGRRFPKARVDAGSPSSRKQVSGGVLHFILLSLCWRAGQCGSALLVHVKRARY